MLVAELGAGVLYSPASASEADDAGVLFTATVAAGSGVSTMVVGAAELACKVSTGSCAPRNQKMDTAATLAAMLAPASGVPIRSQRWRPTRAAAGAATTDRAASAAAASSAPWPYVDSFAIADCTRSATRSCKATPRSARNAAPIME